MCLFDLTECTNVTNTHTDTHRMTAYRPRLHSIVRQKSVVDKKIRRRPEQPPCPLNNNKN